MILKRTTSDNPDFQKLVALLDADLKIRDGEEHAFYAQYNKSATLNEVVVCYENETSVGCGALRVYEQQTVEIKRMFVLPEQRGKGIAQNILKELETWANELGYTQCILETGINQPEAIGLYKKTAYTITPNYGPYKHMENSICMVKSI